MCFVLLEIGFSFLQKGRHSLLLVVRRKERMEQAPLEAQSLLQRQFVCGVHRFLTGPEARLPLAGDFCGHLDRLWQQLVILVHLGDQPARIGLLGGHHVSCQAHVHSLGLADRSRQSLRPPGSRDDAEVDFGLAKLNESKKRKEIIFLTIDSE
jgi:hypothetical protein